MKISDWFAINPFVIGKLIASKNMASKVTVIGSKRKFRANNSRFFEKKSLYAQLTKIIQIRKQLYPKSCKRISDVFAPT